MLDRTFKVTDAQRLTIATALHVLTHIEDTISQLFRAEGLEAPSQASLKGLAEGFAAPPVAVDGVHDLTQLGVSSNGT